MQIETHLYGVKSLGMPVTNSELADYLSERVGLAGKDAITVNVIRQWVAWGVLPKASPKGKAIGFGPAWSRDGTAFRRAVRLAELRRLNIRRESALIVQAFVEWGHPDLKRVRNALRQEFSKWRNQLVRRQITFVGESPFKDISQVQKRAIRKQIGPLDSRFIGSKFEFSSMTFAVIAQFASIGIGNGDDLNSIIIELIVPPSVSNPRL